MFNKISSIKIGGELTLSNYRTASATRTLLQLTTTHKQQNRLYIQYRIINNPFNS